MGGNAARSHVKRNAFLSRMGIFGCSSSSGLSENEITKTGCLVSSSYHSSRHEERWAQLSLCHCVQVLGNAICGATQANVLLQCGESDDGPFGFRKLLAPPDKNKATRCRGSCISFSSFIAQITTSCVQDAKGRAPWF